MRRNIGKLTAVTALGLAGWGILLTGARSALHRSAGRLDAAAREHALEGDAPDAPDDAAPAAARQPTWRPAVRPSPAGPATREAAAESTEDLAVNWARPVVLTPPRTPLLLGSAAPFDAPPPAWAGDLPRSQGTRGAPALKRTQGAVAFDNTFSAGLGQNAGGGRGPRSLAAAQAVAPARVTSDDTATASPAFSDEADVIRKNSGKRRGGLSSTLRLRNNNLRDYWNSRR